MSKKPIDQSGPRRDQRRGATVAEPKAAAARPAETDATAKTASLGSAAAEPRPADVAAASPAAPEPASPVGTPSPSVEPVAASAASPADALGTGPSGSAPAVDRVIAEPSTLDAAAPSTPKDEVRTGASVPLSPRAKEIESPATTTTAEGVSPATARPAEPARGGAGIGSLLAASVLGGLVGAGLMVAYDSLRGGREDLGGRLGQLEQRVAQRPPIEPLEQRLGQLETAQKSAQAALEQTRQVAERGASTAQQALDKPPPATTPATEANAKAIEANARALDDVSKRVGALDGEVKATGEATKALDRRVGEQEKALSGAVQRANEQSTRAAQAMQRTAASERIAEALRSGAPFQPALDLLRRSGADAARLDALAPFAAAGAPTGPALAEAFRPVAERLSAASRTPVPERGAAAQPSGEGGDWTGSLWRLADRIVTVRPSGEAAPDELKGSLDRVASALRAGDLRGALQAYEALPASAKEGSAEFGGRLRSRVAADDAARALAGDALAGLDPSAR